MWTRTVNVDARWDCVSTDNYISKPHFVKVTIRDTYANRPIEDLEEWALRVGNEVTQMMCERACQSLSDSVFCNSIFPDIGSPDEISDIPEAAVSLYSELLDEIERERRRIDRNTDEIADILVTPRDELTSGQRSRIRELDSEIRRSNEIIRDDEMEIRNLEEQYPEISER